MIAVNLLRRISHTRLCKARRSFYAGPAFCCGAQSSWNDMRHPKFWVFLCGMQYDRRSLLVWVWIVQATVGMPEFLTFTNKERSAIHRKSFLFISSWRNL